ncbi:replication initiation protein, partial [Casaltella massiliensis]|nr:replication initiation protein [Casaltella massiliensis]
MVQTNKKAELVVRELLSRQDYLVVQGNDLAKAFGGLKAFEQQLLDYCFSFVTEESKARDIY